MEARHPKVRERKGDKGSTTPPPSPSSSPDDVMVKMIEANSVILGSKSEYFKAMMDRGDWTESQNKVVKVDLSSNEGQY